MVAASEPIHDDDDAPDTLPPAPVSERGRSGEHKRVPTQRETLATLPDLEEDFEPHDTIPAPPWVDDSFDAPKPTN
jgi:hypothetical protein